MAVELGALRFAIQSDLRALRGDLREVGTITKQMEARFQSTQRAAASLFAGVFTVRTVQGIVQTADAFGLYERRIKTATEASGDFEQTNEAINNITRKNFANLGATVSLFQNVKRGAEELSATTPDILEFLDLVQKLGRIGGASAEAQTFGTTQLSQALASGQLRGDELRSILENLPELANAIAKGMGLTVGQMREAAFEGRVLAKDVFESILGQQEEINARAADLAPTISEAGQLVRTELGLALKEIFQDTGANTGLANLLTAIANNMDAIVDVGAAAAAAIAGIFSVRGANALLASLSASVQGLRAKAIATETAAAAEVLATRAELASNAAKLEALFLNAQYAKTTKARINAEAALIAEMEVGRAIQTRYTAAVAAHAVATRAATGTSIALAGATGILSRALAIIGGPLGLAVLAGSAIWLLSRRMNDMGDTAAQASPQLQKFIEDLERIPGVQGQFDSLTAEAERLRKKLADLQEEKARLEAPAPSSAGLVFIDDEPTGTQSTKLQFNVEERLENERTIKEVKDDIAAATEKLAQLEADLAKEARAVEAATVGTLDEIEKATEALQRQLNEQRLILAGREDEIPILREQQRLEDMLAQAVKSKKISEEDAKRVLRDTLPIVSLLAAETEKVKDAIKEQTEAEREQQRLKSEALGIVGRFATEQEKAAMAQETLNLALAAGQIDLAQWLAGMEGIKNSLDQSTEKTRTLSGIVREMQQDFEVQKLFDSGDFVDANSLRILNQLRQDGIEYTEAEAERLQILLEQIDAYEKQQAIVGKLQGMADDLARDLSGALAQAVIAGEDFEEAVKKIIRQTVLLIAQQLILASVAAVVAALTGGLSVAGGAFISTLASGSLTAGIAAAHAGQPSSSDVQNTNETAGAQVKAGLTIVNVSSRQELLGVLASQDGQALIVNAVDRNRGYNGSLR